MDTTSRNYYTTFLLSTFPILLSRNPEPGKSLLESMLSPKQAWYDTDRSEGVTAAQQSPPSRKSSISISDIVERAELGKDEIFVTHNNLTSSFSALVSELL